MSTSQQSTTQTTPVDVAPPAKPLSPVIWVLGLVSLLTDMSSEMVYPVTPLLLTTVLGAPVWSIGLIEGIAESIASILRLFSGYLSDRIGQRKPFALIGYSLGALSKPLIGIAGNWGQVLGARFMDRVGKGLRSAPRDALITENCPPEMRGRAFGLHRSMDTTGAVLGPLLGWLLLTFFLQDKEAAQQLRGLYQIAFFPGLASVLLLLFFVREKRKKEETPKSAAPKPFVPPTVLWRTIKPEYRDYLYVVLLFGLGNSSDAFLLVQAQQHGVGISQILLIYALFNVVEAVLGFPAGKLSDRYGRRVMIASGYAVFAAVYLGFGILKNPLHFLILFPFYGIYYTLTQGSQRALAADLAHPDRRATEIGLYHMAVGIAALPASLLAGWLYTNINQSAPFFLSAALAACAAAMVTIRPPSLPAAQFQNLRIDQRTVTRRPRD